ncbi:DUF5753 domain-containing protein [Actinomadura sp. NPDC048955]|uniref:DUF5753 domain-containing protein n=1 Tax=Actinomadura sp. NPDC048955 TaxID=3158228 RepID=UPI0033E9CC36
MTVQQVPRATANDVLRGKHTSRLRFPVVASLWAVIHHIAAQHAINTQAMTSWEELHRTFHQPRPATLPSAAPTERRHARHEPASPRQTPAAAPGRASGRGTGLISHDPLAASMGLGASFFSAAGGSPPGHSARQATRELLERIRADDDPWWRDFRPYVPDWFGPYLTLERLLSVIRVFAPHRVPGLLQAPGYTQHIVIQDLPGIGSDELARRVELRQVRQQILHRPDAPHYWAVIDQRALGWCAAPPEVLREQIQHLISLAAYPHVTIQLLHVADAEHAVPDGPLTLMRFPETALGDLVFYEHHNDYGHYVDDAQTSEKLLLRFHRLAVQALEPHDSVTRLLHLRGQL